MRKLQTSVIIIVLLTLTFSALGVIPAYATGIVVNTNTDIVNNSDGKCSLREAIASANTDTASGSTLGECAAGLGEDTITFAADYTITLGAGQFEDITTKIIIQGNGESNTKIDGDASSRAFVIASTGELTLKNITIQNGGAARGGAIRHRGGTLTMENCTLTDNSASVYGGGLSSEEGGIITLTNVTFNKNSAPDGGGIYYHDDNITNIGNLTINDGIFSTNSATTNGGGMFNATSSSPKLNGVTFSSNTANRGGGIYNGSSSPRLDKVTFSENKSYQGGGIYNKNSSSPKLIDVTFSNNSTTNNGGGMYNDNSSSPKLTDVTFNNNTADLSGGGIFNNSSSNPELTNVTFNTNTATAGVGGGMRNADSAPMLTNVTFSKNTAGHTDGGGGMANNSGSSPTLKNVTFSDNTAANATTGYAMVNQTIGTNNPIIYNSIFWGSETNQISGGNPTISYSVIKGTCPGTCSDIITADPLLGTLGNYGGTTNTIPLDIGSSAINTGNDTQCASTDQRGVTRPQGSTCDIGAYEYDGTKPTVSITSTATSPTSISPIPVKFEFSEDVTGFEASDITVGNGSAGNFQTVDAKIYTADITPTANGSVTVDIAADIAKDAAGNNNSAATQFSVNYSGSTGTGPKATITLASGQNDPTNNATINFKVTFDKTIDTTTFTNADIGLSTSTAAGTLIVAVSETTPNDNTTFNAQVTGTTGSGDVTITLAAGTVTDTLGTDNVASTYTDNTVAYDIIKPTVTITSTASPGPTNSSTIPVSIKFSEEVSGFVIGDINVTNGNAGNFNTSDNITFTADITPTADGAVKVDVNADIVQDLAGNNNTAAAQFSIAYDTTKPSPTISSSASDPTGTSPIPVTIKFLEEVQNFVAGDITVTNGSAGTLNTTDNITFTTSITPSTNGVVKVDVNADVAQDLAGNNNTEATQFTITYNSTKPTVTISSTASPGPTNSSPIPISIKFSEEVSGFVGGDIGVTNGTAGNFNTSDNITFTADITPTTDGAVKVDVNADVAQDLAGNSNTAAAQFSITYDTAKPTVTITSTASPGPTNTSPIPVKFTFSEDVTGFTVGDIVVGNGSVDNFITVDTKTYTADITPSADGSVTADLNADIALSAALNGNAAATQFSITYDTTAPQVIFGANTTPPNGSVLAIGPSEITVEFNEKVTTASAQDVTNYILVDIGINQSVDTASCAGGVVVDDTEISVDSASYDNSDPYIATLTINGGIPLRSGKYRLFICGTTSIEDEIGNHLNDGVDSTLDFTVQASSTAGVTTSASSLPETGFRHGQVTQLPEQPAAKAYTSTAMLLNIPKLNVSAPIVGVPLSNNLWDVSWLGNSAGYLAGSAFPTWSGNTVITAHVWDAYNRPGIFAELNELRYGDQVQIKAWGLTYIYEVRESKLVTTNNISAAFQSEEHDWITLVTCEFYNPFSGNYLFRRTVRAVLVGVK